MGTFPASASFDFLRSRLSTADKQLAHGYSKFADSLRLQVPAIPNSSNATFFPRLCVVTGRFKLVV